MLRNIHKFLQPLKQPPMPPQMMQRPPPQPPSLSAQPTAATSSKGGVVADTTRANIAPMARQPRAHVTLKHGGLKRKGPKKRRFFLKFYFNLKIDNWLIYYISIVFTASMLGGQKRKSYRSVAQQQQKKTQEPIEHMDTEPPPPTSEEKLPVAEESESTSSPQVVLNVANEWDTHSAETAPKEKKTSAFSIHDLIGAPDDTQDQDPE